MKNDLTLKIILKSLSYLLTNLILADTNGTQFYCFNFFTNEVNNSYLFMCNSIVNLITFIHTFIKAQLASHCLCWMPLFLDGEWRCTTLTFGKVDILFKNAYNLVLAKAFKEEMVFLFFMSDLISLSSHHNWQYIFWWWSSNASIVNMDLFSEHHCVMFNMIYAMFSCSIIKNQP